MQLSYAMRRELESLSRQGDRYPWAKSIANPTMRALEKRGLVKWNLRPSDPYFGEYKVTDEGRAALSN